MMYLIRKLFGFPKTGTDKVAQIRDSFTTMITELEEAEADLHIEQSGIEDRIIQLKAQSLQLGTTLNQSLALSDGLKKLVGV